MSIESDMNTKYTCNTNGNPPCSPLLSFKKANKNETHHEVAQLGIKLREPRGGEEHDNLVPLRIGVDVLAQQQT